MFLKTHCESPVPIFHMVISVLSLYIPVPSFIYISVTPISKSWFSKLEACCLHPLFPLCSLHWIHLCLSSSSPASTHHQVLEHVKPSELSSPPPLPLPPLLAMRLTDSNVQWSFSSMMPAAKSFHSAPTQSKSEHVTKVA